MRLFFYRLSTAFFTGVYIFSAYLVVTIGMPIVLALALHISLSCGISYFLSRSHPKLHIHSAILYLGAMIFFSIYGLIAVFVYAGIEILNDDDNSLIDEEEIEDIEAQPLLDTEVESKDIIKHKLKIQSYYDILFSNDIHLKKALINRLHLRKKASDIPLLKIALNDDDYEIRTFASTTLSRLEKHFNTIISNIRSTCSQEPENTRLRIKLIYKYYLYIRSGILTPELIHYYFNESEVLLKEIDMVKNNSKKTINKMLVLKILLNPYNPDKEQQLLLCNAILSQYPSHHAAFNQLCALLYERGEIQQLKDLYSKAKVETELWVK